MVRKLSSGCICFLFLSLVLASQGFAEDDKIVQLAIDTVKTQMRFPKGMEVQFAEKKESPIPDFYSVKLLFLARNREIPMIVYVDKAGEKVIIGTLFIKGENMTRKEAGDPRPRKIDMGQLEIENSPFRGPGGAKVTIVEFTNFKCPYCQKSWTKMKGMLEKYPKEIKYVFKHFPFQAKGETYDLSEMAAAAQSIGNDAFWLVHDYLFSGEGQAMNKSEKGVVKQKIEQLLKENNFDVTVFQAALENGKARKRVEEDLALGNRYQVSGTPAVLINGEMIQGLLTEQVLERYLKK
jgi:protein-disulfide isomerase